MADERQVVDVTMKDNSEIESDDITVAVEKRRRQVQARLMFKR